MAKGSCQSGSWVSQGAKYNADISPDYGVVELAGGLKMAWQRYVFKSCVDWFTWRVTNFTSTDGGAQASCDMYFPFKKPFPSYTYFVTAMGQDNAAGASVSSNTEGSEMSFGVINQSTSGVTIKIMRNVGSNGNMKSSLTETMGVIIYAIGM